MKKFIILFVLIGIGSLSYGYKVWADAKETELAKIPLENYLKGHETGNPEFMRKAFHTEGKLIFIRDGKYTTRTLKNISPL